MCQIAYPYFPSQDPVPTPTSSLNLGDNTMLNNASLVVMIHQLYGHTRIPTVSVVDARARPPQFSFTMHLAFVHP
jgi:hypothetical protein